MPSEIVLLERRWTEVDGPWNNPAGPPILIFHVAPTDSSATRAGEQTRGFEPVATPWSVLPAYLQCSACAAASLHTRPSQP
jgi:hypothetical protein